MAERGVFMLKSTLPQYLCVNKSNIIFNDCFSNLEMKKNLKYEGQHVQQPHWKSMREDADDRY